jgi:hypothetical protein
MTHLKKNDLDCETPHFIVIVAIACNKIEVVLLFDDRLVDSAGPTRFSFDF